ncbi:MAG: hypothetical protein WBH10_06590 [Allopontixanthobacter sediminis]
MQHSAFVLAAASTIVLCACTTPSGEAALQDPDEMQTADDCPVIESEGWAATITPVPGNPDRNQLTITGQVTMPTPGYTFAWEPGRLDRSAVPAFELRLLANPPAGMVTQVLDTREVSYSGPAAAARYRSISITCEGRVLGTIEDIR